MSDAANRLESSRARLRLAMTPPPPRVGSSSSARADAASPRLHRQHDSWLSGLINGLTKLPALRAMMESLGAWWSHHPLKPIAHIANEASTAAVKPLAQRNPLTLVLAAASVGAMLSFARPWRWIFRSALFAGLVPQLAIRVIASLPIESWMTMASSALSRSAAASAPRAPVNPNTTRPSA